MSISPFFRSPFTDLTGGLVSHQMLGKCQKQEAEYMECLEVYGLDRGRTKCAQLFGDFHECQTMTKQFLRFVIQFGGLCWKLKDADCAGLVVVEKWWCLCLALYVFCDLKDDDDFKAIRNEREKQIAAGKLKGDEKYVTPRIDSY